MDLETAKTTGSDAAAAPVEASEPQVQPTAGKKRKATGSDAAVEASEPQDQPTAGKKRKATSTPSESGDSAQESCATTDNYDDGRKAIAEMIIKRGLSFEMVEDEAFKAYSKFLDPEYEVPSSMTVQRDVLAMYMLKKQKLKNYFKKNHPRVCLAIETWTSIQNLKYMCISAHFIDHNWKLHKKIINFRHIESHKGSDNGKTLRKCLSEWGIDKVLTVTFDNCSANETAVTCLKDRVMKNNAIMNAEFLRVRCAAHVLAHVVKAGLKKYRMSISKIREVIEYVLSKPCGFTDCVAKEKIACGKGLVSDDRTRWNSTYFMLEAAEKFEKAFQRLETEDTKFFKMFGSSNSASVPSSTCSVDKEASSSDFESYEVASCSDSEPDEEAADPGKKTFSSGSESDKETSYAEDWCYAKIFAKFLKVFLDATVKLTAPTYLTSESFLWQLCVIHKQFSIWVNSEDPFLNNMAKTMFHKYNKYWGSYEDMNPFLFIAVLLDPREKEFGLKFRLDVLCEKDEDLAVKLMGTAKSVLEKLYGEYKLLYSGAENGGAEASNLHDTEMKDSEDNFEVVLRQRLEKLKEGSVKYKSELDRYLAETRECSRANPQFDLLDWWKTNSTKYSILSYIARDVLAIPVSSVTSKSTFSTGKRVLDPFRSSLTPTTAEAVVCLQSWLLSTTDLDLSGLGDRFSRQ